MRVLVVGAGAREHVLVDKISQNTSISVIYAAPGNAGISELAQCVDIAAEDIEGLADFATKKAIDLTVVGPEAPLVDGIVDLFYTRGIRVFGPDKQAARLEGSKSFAKKLMLDYGIPTAKGMAFSDHESTIEHIRDTVVPFVVKADGLAAGKGVTVCFDKETAKGVIQECFVDEKFGEAGKTVIIEEYLEGQEVTVMAFTDGETVLPMLPAQDHKPVFDQDKGPNTGGMGAYSPVPAISGDLYKEIVDRFLKPTVDALRTEGVIYRGILYAGLILTKEGPKILEFNCRFGDPEAQVVLPLLKTDLMELILATTEGNLKDYKLKWQNRVAVSVVLASKGYPGAYKKGHEIKGLDAAGNLPDIKVYHAGTAKKDSRTVTSGGRVLNVVGFGDDHLSARFVAYEGIKQIEFEGMHYRTDIAEKAITVSSD